MSGIQKQRADQSVIIPAPEVLDHVAPVAQRYWVQLIYHSRQAPRCLPHVCLSGAPAR